MKWKLKTSGNFYSKKDAERLKVYGFTFKPDGTFKDKQLYQTSEEVDIKIKSLKDLKALEDKFGCSLVISLKNKTVEIYNDWRE